MYQKAEQAMEHAAIAYDLLQDLTQEICDQMDGLERKTPEWEELNGVLLEVEEARDHADQIAQLNCLR